MSGTDWVLVWEGLRGTRDFRAVVQAGDQLHDALVVARRAWSEAAAAHRAQIASLEGDVLAAEGALEQHCCDDDADGLVDVVRVWHDADHADAWPVCPHPVCRAAIS